MILQISVFKSNLANSALNFFEVLRKPQFMPNTKKLKVLAQLDGLGSIKGGKSACMLSLLFTVFQLNFGMSSRYVFER